MTKSKLSTSLGKHVKLYLNKNKDRLVFLVSYKKWLNN